MTAGERGDVLNPLHDDETQALLAELSNLQTWATILATRNVPKAMDAYDLIQRTRIYIIERTTPPRPRI